jgi:hypothetical protein
MWNSSDVMLSTEILWFTASTTDPRSIHPPDTLVSSRGVVVVDMTLIGQYDPEEIQELEDFYNRSSESE